MPENKDSVEDKLITSFNDQFATNQNHGQLVFIQFLSAILVVLIGYGYVYANTNKTAAIWDIQKTCDTQVMISYAAMHLFGAYYISELILTLLATVILNIGYGFKRDQKVIKNIRTEYLSNYNAIFGSASFDPSGKNLVDYLPEFNRMFVFGIFTLQTLLLISFCFSLGHFNNWVWWGWWTILIYPVLFFPVLWSIFVYLNYYKKYYWVMTDSDECGLLSICFKSNKKRWPTNSVETDQAANA